jgi:uncharacterized protein (DUF736 family)
MNNNYENNSNQISNLSPIKQEFKQNKQRPPDNLGAIWKKINDKGVEYLSLKIELDNGTIINAKAFLNSEKRDSNSQKPDYILYKSKNIKKEVDGNR